MFLESNTGNSCQVCSLQIRNLLHKMFQSSASPSLELGKKGSYDDFFSCFCNRKSFLPRI